MGGEHVLILQLLNVPEETDGTAEMAMGRLRQAASAKGTASQSESFGVRSESFSPK
jgi:hypothetical protein